MFLETINFLILINPNKAPVIIIDKGAVILPNSFSAVANVLGSETPSIRSSMPRKEAKRAGLNNDKPTDLKLTSFLYSLTPNVNKNKFDIVL